MKLLLVVALIALPLVAFAGPQEKQAAQKHIANATEAHQQSRFDVALTELETAYTLDPQPDLLFAIGQVHVKLDNCPAAISFYERFLETKPAADAASATTEAIDTCRARLAAQPTTMEPPPQEAFQPMPQPPAPQPAPRRFDAIGTTLVGLGVFSTVVGVVMYSTAISKLDDAERARTYQSHERLVDDAEGKRAYAIMFAAGGIAAIAIGSLHYVRFRDKEKARVAITPSTHGGMVSWSGSF